LILKAGAGSWFQNECLDDDDCKIEYSRDHTPLLLAVSPTNIYAGQRIQYHVYMKNTLNYLSSDVLPFTEFKLGGTNIDISYDDDSVYNNNIDESYRPSNWDTQYF
jgi:hypothetical protein